MVSVRTETGLLLLYRQRLETDLQASQLIFDIVDSCSVLCISHARDALAITCIPPCLPSSSLGSSLLALSGSAAASSSSSSVPAALPSPVRSARGRHCLDVCIARYLDAMEHTRGRLERQVVDAMRAERDSRGRTADTERQREDAGRRQRLGTGAGGGGAIHSAALAGRRRRGKAGAEAEERQDSGRA